MDALFWILITVVPMGWGVYDCVRHEADSSRRSLWLAVIILLAPLGAALYRVLRVRARQKSRS